MLFLQFFVVYWDLGNMNLEKKFKIFFYLFLRNGFLKKVSELNWTKQLYYDACSGVKKGLLTQFTVVTLCTKGFLKFHQHKMTIENNFITNDKIDTCPAFHLIYLLQSLQMLTNRFIVFFIRNKATPEFSHVLIKELGLFCVKRKL